MSESIQAEQERVLGAIEKTGYKTHDFLQRLEAQSKMTHNDHMDRFAPILERRSEIKDNFMYTTKQTVKKMRRTIDTKYERHDG